MPLDRAPPPGLAEELAVRAMETRREAPPWPAPPAEGVIIDDEGRTFLWRLGYRDGVTGARLEHPALSPRRYVVVEFPELAQEVRIS